MWKVRPLYYSHNLKRLLSRGKALVQKRHSFRGVMNFEGNFEAKDLMKRASWLVQGFKLLSRMLTRSVRLRRTTKGGLFPTYITLFCALITFKKLKQFDFPWGFSSAGEHMTEAHGVRGSTPRLPIFRIFKDFKKKDL